MNDPNLAQYADTLQNLRTAIHFLEFLSAVMILGIFLLAFLLHLRVEQLDKRLKSLEDRFSLLILGGPIPVRSKEEDFTD
jgi:hypothetical protein